MSEGAAEVTPASDALNGERPLASTVVAGLTTAADKIRALILAGYTRGETAALLDIRYQQVRHVLVRSNISLGLVRKKDHLPRTTRADRAMAPADDTVPEADAMALLLGAGFVRLGHWTSIGDEAFETSCAVPSDAHMQ